MHCRANAPTNHCGLKKKLREYLALCTTGFFLVGFTHSISPTCRSPLPFSRD
jgi:hypothetical protein